MVQEGIPAGPFLLELWGSEEVWGRVQGPWGGVPAVGIRISSRGPSGASLSDRALTDLEGKFRARLVRGAGKVELVASPPGYGLQALEFAAGEEPFVLEIHREAGRLELRLPENQDSRPWQWFLFQGNLHLSPQVLFDWARGHGVLWAPDSGGVTIPDLAPGSYRACLGSPANLTSAA